MRGPVAMMTLSPLGRRKARDFAARDLDQRMLAELGAHRVREPVAVDRERAPGRNLVGVRRRA